MAEEQPVLVVIAADPRSSHRAFEAMRIGVGVVAGENEVTFVLRGPAVHLLDADTDDLVDGDDIARFRESLKRLGVPFHVEEDADPGRPPTGTPTAIRSCGSRATASPSWSAQGRRFIVF